MLVNILREMLVAGSWKTFGVPGASTGTFSDNLMPGMSHGRVSEYSAYPVTLSDEWSDLKRGLGSFVYQSPSQRPLPAASNDYAARTYSGWRSPFPTALRSLRSECHGPAVVGAPAAMISNSGSGSAGGTK
jgi:hypothetical protein